MRFAIPFQRDDLYKRESTESNAPTYSVRTIYSYSDLKTLLDDCKTGVRQNGCKFLTNPEINGFDICYSVVYLYWHEIVGSASKSGRRKSAFGNQFGIDTLISCLMILKRAMDDLNSELDKFLENDVFLKQMRNEWLNLMKMCVYLFCQTMEAVLSYRDSKENSLSDRLLSSHIKRKRGGLGSSSGESGGSDLFDIEEQRSCVCKLYNLLIMNTQLLFDPPLVEKEFVELIGNILFRMLESPVVALAKGKDLKQSIFQCMYVLNSRMSYSLSCRLKMVQSLILFQHLPKPYAESFVYELSASNVSMGPSMVMEFIRELSKQIDTNTLNKDTSATKNVATFFTELAELSPAYIFPSMSLIIDHLECGESATMRRAILTVMGEVIIGLLTPQSQEAQGDDNEAHEGRLTEERKRSERDHLLSYLMDHIVDVNAHVRSTALVIWGKLCGAKAIPLAKQNKLLKAVLNRIQDRSCIVRKQGVQLLRILLECNPYTSTMPISQFESELETEMKVLQDLRCKMGLDKDEVDDSSDISSTDDERDEDDTSENNCRDKKWAVMAQTLEDMLEAWDVEKSVEESVREDETADSENDDSDNNTDEEEEEISVVFENLRKLMDSNKLEETLQMLKRNRRRLQTDFAKKFGESNVTNAGEDVSSMSEDKDTLLLILRCIYLFDGERNTEVRLSDYQGESDASNGKDVTDKGLSEKEKVSSENEQALAKQLQVVSYLKDSIEFGKLINERGVPKVCWLLRSKQVSDILEAVSFFVSAFEFGVLHASTGVRKMLPLIWSQETEVREALISAYIRLYITGGDVNNPPQPSSLVSNFITLIDGANVGELICFEKLLTTFVKEKHMGLEFFQSLWQTFLSSASSNGGQGKLADHQRARCALLLLSMCAKNWNGGEMITQNVDSLLNHCSSSSKTNGRSTDMHLVSESLSALYNVAPALIASRGSGGACRLPSDDPLFTRIESLLLNEIVVEEHNMFIGASQHAIMTIYATADKPDLVVSRLIVRCRNLAGNAASKSGENSCLLLQRLIAIVGHVAVCQMSFLEGPLLTLLNMNRKMTENGSVGHGDDKEKKSRRRQQGRKSLVDGGGSTSSCSTSSNDEMQEMVEGGGGTCNGEQSADDTESELMRHVCDTQMIDNSILTPFIPVVREICSNVVQSDKYKSEISLCRVSCTTLAKIMLVSSVFCRDNLSLFFTLLDSCEDEIIRANLVAATCDLCIHFPNLLEPWTPLIYKRLHDSSIHVRYNALTVITHLTLNDMIKVKSQISDVAQTIMDADGKVASMAKYFFTQLARKSTNALYNVIPDIISNLSSTTSKKSSSSSSSTNFKSIMTFILNLIDKDRQLDSLVEKICLRFPLSDNVDQSRNLSYCLSLLKINSDKGLRRLIDMIGVSVGSWLHDDQIYNDILGVCGSVRKQNAKADLKMLVDELEESVEASRKKAVEEEFHTRQSSMLANKMSNVKVS